jgi:carbon starvation protein CstA
MDTTTPSVEATGSKGSLWSMAALSMVIEGAIITAVVFLFHALPIAGMWFETNVTNGKPLAWLWLILYYFVAALLAIWLYRYLVTPLLVKMMPKYVMWYERSVGKLKSRAKKPATI